jgi:hypothetical protein
MKHRVNPLAKLSHLLLVGVRVVRVILQEVVEPFAVLEDTARALL